ncbi:MAG: hypothetical protein ACRDGR_01620 [bacterium]
MRKNYGFEKREKERKRQAKQEKKRERRQAKKGDDGAVPTDGDAPVVDPEGDEQV